MSTIEHKGVAGRRTAKNGKEYVELRGAFEAEIGDVLVEAQPIREGNTPRERRRGKQIGTTYHRFTIEGFGKTFTDELVGTDWKRAYGTYSREDILD